MVPTVRNGSTHIIGRLEVALHHIKYSEEPGTVADAQDTVPLPHAIGQVRPHGDEPEGNKLEKVLRNLNTLLEEHLNEWLALPQSKRVEVALQELKKL